MRISTSYIFDQNLIAMLNQQTALSQTQLQISTGKKILNPSDDPAGSVQILNLQREFSVTEQYLTNADKVTNKLRTEEGVLQSAADIVQRIRELAVQGLNDSNNQQSRQGIAAEMDQLNKQLLALANTADSQGDYVFSGFSVKQPPYPTVSSSYQGDEGQRNIKIGDGVFVEVNDPGHRVFGAEHRSTTITKSPSASTSAIQITIKGQEVATPVSLVYNAGTGAYDITSGSVTTAVSYTATDSGKQINLNSLDPSLPDITLTLSGTPASGDTFTLDTTISQQTVFKTIDQFVQALKSNQVGPNDGPNNNDFLNNMSNALDQITLTQAKVGSRLNAVDHQRNVNEGLKLSNERILSQIQDLDYAEAVSRLSLQSTGLQAAQQSFVKVQGLSLFNYL